MQFRPIKAIESMRSGLLFSVNNVKDSHGANQAPLFGDIGIWIGDGKTDDNQSDYYITHEYSFYGRKINSANIGDSFKIKGTTYKIYNILKVDKTEIVKNIMKEALPSYFGSNMETASIQVCIPHSNYNRIVIAKKIK